MPSFLMLEVPFLSWDESLKLFRAHIDPQVINQISDDVVREVVAKCDGLPLTVEVIGSYLRLETDVTIWKGTLERLRNAESIDGSADDKLWKKLRVSFDSLGIPEQMMFLDLAVFEKCEPDGIQYDMEIWKAVWSSVDPTTVIIGLRNLQDKYFIRTWIGLDDRMTIHRGGSCLKLSNKPVFVVIHEQLRDMGKSIFRPSRERIELCRGVWRSKDVDELLAEYAGDNAKTEALSVALDQNVTLHLEKQYAWSSIGHLRELRLMRMISVGMTGEGAERFPSSLAFVHMNRCSKGKTKGPFPFLESECWPIRAEDVGALHKLTVLALENCLFVRFPENFHKLKNLRTLIISGKQLTELPEKFGLLRSLRVLVLENVGLSELPDSFVQLSSLQSLDIRDCSALKTLHVSSVPRQTVPAQDIASSLCMLTRLTLDGLPALRELPEMFLPLGCLEVVRISRCSALLKLPESFGMSRKLKRLKIYDCESLESLGEFFGALECLFSLKIKRCSSLWCLPETLGQLQNLVLLKIEKLGISNLPASLWDLDKLHTLELHDLKCLMELPERMGQMDMAPGNDGRSHQRFCESVRPLRSLGRLLIETCGMLQSLPECLGETDSLECLAISSGSLERLQESVGLLRNLTTLHVRDCESLRTLPDSLGEMVSLREIDIINCGSLERLPESVGILRNLDELTVYACKSLTTLPGRLGEIVSLREIHINGCRSLERLPESVGLLRNLKGLYVSDYESLRTLPERLGEIVSLREIHINGLQKSREIARVRWTS